MRTLYNICSFHLACFTRTSISQHPSSTSSGRNYAQLVMAITKILTMVIIITVILTTIVVIMIIIIINNNNNNNHHHHQ